VPFTVTLNAGCRITSIQRFLGHKKLNTTMINARAHDQTVADDYFAAMGRIEQRLEIEPETEQAQYEVVRVREQNIAVQLTERLAMPELCFAERLDITAQLRELFGPAEAHVPPARSPDCDISPPPVNPVLSG
jgi:hypothetical protein